MYVCMYMGEGTARLACSLASNRLCVSWILLCLSVCVSWIFLCAIETWSPISFHLPKKKTKKKGDERSQCIGSKATGVRLAKMPMPRVAKIFAHVVALMLIVSP
jgi:hypothetical protein